MVFSKDDLAVIVACFTENGWTGTGIAKEFLNKKWNLSSVYERRREPFANLKDIQNVIKTNGTMSMTMTVRKAILQWKRRLAAVAKQDGGPIQHIFC